MQPVFRFAPSPNGELHLGHAYSALLDFEMARQAGGRFLLRIEDIDRARCRPEYEAGIHRDLALLGISWEVPVRRLSQHFADYAAALRKLEAMGLVYPAFLSRAEIAAAATGRDPDGAPLYPGVDRDLDPDEAAQRIAAGAPYAMRLRMDEAAERARPLAWTETGEAATVAVDADPRAWGDVVLARKETPTSYHLSVVVDDAMQGVTHVVRGRDLFHATSVHVLLQRLLGLPTPVYHHHRLVTDAGGRKLSRSDRDTSLRALREAGATSDDMRRMVGLGTVMRPGSAS
jgi:glutamyl-Q tRNA(Asp) synthetase